MDAAVVELADRLAREAGWPEEPWETRRDRPGFWSKGVLGVADAVGRLALGPWRVYIETRSGHRVKLSGILWLDI